MTQMPEIEPESSPCGRDSLLIGDTDAETLHNIGCVLQVLADATGSELSSPEVRGGWWLLLQEISQVGAGIEFVGLERSNAGPRSLKNSPTFFNGDDPVNKQIQLTTMEGLRLDATENFKVRLGCRTVSTAIATGSSPPRSRPLIQAVRRYAARHPDGKRFPNETRPPS